MKVMTVVGTRPEIIRLSRIVAVLDREVRPGEKIHEIMVSDEEAHRTVERASGTRFCRSCPRCAASVQVLVV